MNIEEINKWLDNEYGVSYTRLEELHDYFFEKYTDQKEEIERLKKKYNKALELLVDYNLPCEYDEFNIENSDYCEINCSVDDEVYKKCWDKYIELELKDSDSNDSKRDV